MTGYYIYIGYNSVLSEFDVWQELKRVAAYYCENYNLIADDAVEIEGRDPKFNEKIFDYAKNYNNHTDLTIKIVDQKSDDIGNRERYIAQLASAGGYSREVKEILRRAFCRVVLREMHKKGMEVCISVG